MTREIVLDTETTGLCPVDGHRVVEIGCVELVNHMPTGRHWHHYFNPERDMPEEAWRIHGLGDDFLADKPPFAAEAENFLGFIADDTLIIHNAAFDMGFLNAELERLRRPALINPVIDTVTAGARTPIPAPASASMPCASIYGIDNSRRTLHGALLDSEILADVYLELIGGRQVALALSAAAEAEAEQRKPDGATIAQARPRPIALPSRLSTEDKAAHQDVVKSIGDKAIWSRYSD